jgi:hypothetical protein
MPSDTTLFYSDGGRFFFLLGKIFNRLLYMRKKKERKKEREKERKKEL